MDNLYSPSVSRASGRTSQDLSKASCVSFQETEGKEGRKKGRKGEMVGREKDEWEGKGVGVLLVVL